ncbi:MAG: phosphatidate cytidylyltransferase [Eggerthellaceae bacterium]|nr:phosphatidate cytidylyltransferase [Eggerthellaceae bacterium]
MSQDRFSEDAQGDVPRYWEDVRESEGVWEGDGWQVPAAHADSDEPGAEGSGIGEVAFDGASDQGPADGFDDGQETLEARERLRRRLGKGEEAHVSPAPVRTTRTGEPKPDSGKRAQRVKEKAYEKTPDRFKNPSDLQVRLRTGILYITLNIVCVLAGDVTTMIILSVTAAICAGEFYYMLRSDAKMPNEFIGTLAAAAYPVSVFFFDIFGVVLVTALLLLAVTIWYVYWLRARVADVGICVFGAMYTGMQLSGLLLIRMSIDGLWGGVIVLVIFASIWFNDAGAYMFGSRFGKHKLAPRTSPKKSWEGFIAGLVVSMAIWCIMLAIPGVQITVWQCMLFGLVCGLTSVLGDLCESRIKRSVGFKDSGTIMPGHGGLFDRCDSLMPTAVAAAILLFGFGCLPMPF